MKDIPDGFEIADETVNEDVVICMYCLSWTCNITHGDAQERMNYHHNNCDTREMIIERIENMDESNTLSVDEALNRID